MGKFGVGQPVRRVEDQRFLTGTGQFTDDITVPGQLHLYVLRSPYAHAEIRRIDSTAAKAAAGVVAVFTGADFEKLGIGPIPVAAIPPANDGVKRSAPFRPAIATGRVRYVGEPVAGVIADTPANARDAAELIEIDYDELPVAATMPEALAAGAAALHAPHYPSNLLLHWAIGDDAATKDAFAKADKVVSIDIVNTRIAPTAIEPRAVIAEVDQTGRITLTLPTQGGHGQRRWLATSVFKIPEDRIRIVTPDVGGAFGMKNFLFNETVICAVAARELKKPVKWTADRSESFLNDVHGRDQLSHAEMAVTKDGKFLAIRVSSLGNVGAYLSQFGAFIPTAAGGAMHCGVYTFQAAAVDVKVVLTNTTPLDAYRGAGRPEAAYLLERLIEKAARELGIPSVELRRRNFIKPEQFPFKTALGQNYDSGRYEEVMDAALKRADFAGIAARRAEAKTRGKLRGIGVSYYVEACAGGSGEQPLLSFDRNGKLTIRIGTQNNGQGHETVYAQIAADMFDIAMEDVIVIQGDTDLVPTGNGTGGSRSIPVGGSAVQVNVAKMIDQGKQMAAELLEAAAVDVEFAEGNYRIAGTDRAVTLKDVIAASFGGKRPDGVAEGLFSSENFNPSGATFPNGCHICELDVDAETGAIDFVRYTIQDDLGIAVNPMTMAGQIHGGAVQGLGQALYEEAIYDSAGQLLTGSFMDYCMPRADNTPSFDFAYSEVPSPRNALGAKGAGEAGTVGATPAVANAVLDALAAVGVTHLDMPMTPLRIWQAMQAAKAQAA